MKYLFIIAIVFFHFNLFAAELYEDDIKEIPSYICDGLECSQFQIKIVDQFLKANQVTNVSPAVYSGNCYHLDQNYDGNHAHYGVIYLVPNQNKFFWGGLFSFFDQSNPFKKLNVLTAREKFGAVEEKSANELSKEIDYLFVNYGDNEKFTRYWIRQDKDLKHLFVLSLWGIDHRMMCDLTKNK